MPAETKTVKTNLASRGHDWLTLRLCNLFYSTAAWPYCNWLTKMSPHVMADKSARLHRFTDEIRVRRAQLICDQRAKE